MVRQGIVSLLVQFVSNVVVETIIIQVEISCTALTELTSTPARSCQSSAGHAPCQTQVELKTFLTIAAHRSSKVTSKVWEITFMALGVETGFDLTSFMWISKNSSNHTVKKFRKGKGYDQMHSDN